MAVDVQSLYERYGPMVYRRCRALLRDDQAAEELMQETFIQLLRRRDMEVASPSSMLYRTATNLCLNKLRAQGRRPETPVGDLVMRIAMAPTDQESASIARNVLDYIFQAEQPSTRTIATLLLLDGMTLEQVAEEVGMSVSGVRKRVRTLRAHVVELEGVA